MWFDKWPTSNIDMAAKWSFRLRTLKLSKCLLTFRDLPELSFRSTQEVQVKGQPTRIPAFHGKDTWAKSSQQQTKPYHFRALNSERNLHGNHFAHFINCKKTLPSPIPGSPNFPKWKKMPAPFLRLIERSAHFDVTHSHVLTLCRFSKKSTKDLVLCRRRP